MRVGREATRRIAKATLVGKASDAALVVNTEQMESGRIGIALALPPGQPLSAGASTLVTIQFSPAADGSQVSAHVSFGDEPVTREVSDVNANPVAAIFTDAMIGRQHPGESRRPSRRFR